MVDPPAHEWLKDAVTKAAAESPGQAPQEVIIRQATKAVTFPTPCKPFFKVTAWVRMTERGFQVALYVAEDGSYSDFQAVK